MDAEQQAKRVQFDTKHKDTSTSHETGSYRGNKQYGESEADGTEWGLRGRRVKQVETRLSNRLKAPVQIRFYRRIVLMRPQVVAYGKEGCRLESRLYTMPCYRQHAK